MCLFLYSNDCVIVEFLDGRKHVCFLIVRTVYTNLQSYSNTNQGHPMQNQLMAQDPLA